MTLEYRVNDWDTLRMEYGQPHRELEPPANEIAVVDAALEFLRGHGVIPHTEYDHAKFLAHRQAVRDLFEIPWTAISPRVQRLLYALNAIRAPKRMLAAGVFCGNTFISNAGAGVGPGASYAPDDLVGVEIKPDEAERAERNVRRIDPTGVARVLAADAVEVARDYPHPIDLLYLDASSPDARGKGIYLEICQAAMDKLAPDALVLAHNSVNGGAQVQHYLDFARDPANFRVSVNVVLDREGVEVTAR